MVEMHANSSNSVKTRHSTNATSNTPQSQDVTTQMMMNGEPNLVNWISNNQSKILIWTDHEERDLFSIVLKKRLSYLQSNSCPVLRECSFAFSKKSINDADTVVVATKRHFPYGGSQSGKTWTLIIPGLNFSLRLARAKPKF